MTSGSKSEKTVVSPLSEHKVTCPMCDKLSTMQKPKARLYVEQDPDVDLHPRKFMWSLKGVATPHPPLYYMWRCDDCNFTASNTSFEAPLKNATISVPAFKARLEAVKRKKPEVNKVMNEFATLIENSEVDYSQAVAMHLLAIYNLYIVEDTLNKDSIELAKYCLRLGWLYRELEADKAAQAKSGPVIKKLIDAVKADWPAVPKTEEQSLKMAVELYKTALEKSSAITTAGIEVELKLLISRVSMKLNDIPEARKFVEVAKSRMKKEEEDVAKKKNEGVDVPAEILGELRKLNMTIEKVQDILTDFRAAWEDEQMEKAKSMVETNQGKSSDQIKELLASSGIDSKIIAQVLKPATPQKKGLFGFLG